jgi:hypothetical protein
VCNINVVWFSIGVSSGHHCRFHGEIAFMSLNKPGNTSNLPQFIDSLPYIPWFRNLGKPHPNDRHVRRIRHGRDWPGPEEGYGDWFGRFPALVREQMYAENADRQVELDKTWARVEPLVLELAIANLPDYDDEADAYHWPNACAWQASYNAALVGCHILLVRPLPEPIADQWSWLTAGHWPCDYGEEPIGYWQSIIDVPGSKLLVY